VTERNKEEKREKIKKNKEENQVEEKDKHVFIYLVTSAPYNSVLTDSAYLGFKLSITNSDLDIC
jgi:hypothetical protein